MNNMEKLNTYIQNQTILEVTNFDDKALDGEFNHGIETGMHIRVIDVSNLPHGDGLKITLNTQGFDERNDPLLKRDYWDKDGKPTLNAKESGDWKDKPVIYLDINTPIDEMFVPVSGPELELMKIHESNNDGRTFMQFLIEQSCLQNDIDPPVVDVKIKKTPSPGL